MRTNAFRRLPTDTNSVSNGRSRIPYFDRNTLRAIQYFGGKPDIEEYYRPVMAISQGQLAELPVQYDLIILPDAKESKNRPKKVFKIIV